MKFSEIKNLSFEALRKRYTQVQKEKFELKMKHSLGQVGNPLQIRRARKDIARILTVFNAPTSTAPPPPSPVGSKTNQRKESQKDSLRGEKNQKRNERKDKPKERKE